MEKIKCEIRNKNAHNSAKRVRKDGKVPGVIYGHGSDSTLISVDKNELNKEILKEGDHALLDVEINNENHTAFIKEVQRDVINRELLHIDFQEVNKNERITTEIPISITGEGALISKGGILQRERDTVKVKCNVDNIPKTLNVDVASLNVGDVFRVADLEVAEEITFGLEMDSIILAVNYVSNKIEEEVEDKDDMIRSIVKDEERIRKEEMA
ncbi:50S ribosomal protein L25/general stress protein Ctc [Clostridium sediminicola]|uniref:50S ribosomal protein L25 n=1 Tax=Clostridium sediminicola TaxID=3114879 RepID=UPI0031F253FD